jgi:hypothetical protein
LLALFKQSTGISKVNDPWQLRKSAAQKWTTSNPASNQRLPVVIGFGPMQNLVTLSQSRQKKRICLKQRFELLLGVSLRDPQTAFGRL